MKFLTLITTLFLSFFLLSANIFSASEEIDDGVSHLVSKFGTTVYKNKKLYDIFLYYTEEMNYNPRALGEIIAETGNKALLTKGWIKALKSARANGLSDEAVAILVGRFGQGVKKPKLADLVNSLNVLGYTADGEPVGLSSGEAKARIVSAHGTSADNKKVRQATLLLLQYMDFIKDEKQRAAFIKFRKKNPRKFKRFVKIKSFKEREKYLQAIMNRYGK